jgi:TetR/AcrR family transcriptional regulator, regulator of cefoperazone and chloramphenicol sensitivity
MRTVEVSPAPMLREHAAVRQRIVEAAGEVFAELGYEGATVRSITERAGVNVAAINYYFRDKACLYEHVVSACCCSTQEAADACPWPEGAPAEERLRFFIERMVRRALNPERPGWHRLVMAREMITPTPALDRMVRESIGPERDQLVEALDEMTGHRLSDRERHLFGFSIVGQCLFYMQNGPLIGRLCPMMDAEPPTVSELIAHIQAFSLAAVRSLALSLEAGATVLRRAGAAPR